MKRVILLLIITAAGATVLISSRGAAPPVTALDPGLGPVTLFFQSQAGLITVIIALVVLALLLFGGEILHLTRLLLLNIFASAISEEKRLNRTLSRRIEASENKLDATEQALQEFTTAVAEYARHLSSHNSSIQGLTGASHELQGGSASRSRFLEEINKNTEERLVSKEALLATLKDIPPPEEDTRETEKPTPKKTRPSYRDLHPRPPASPTAPQEKSSPAAKKTPPESASLVEAMVLPYYRALDRLDMERPAPRAEKPPPKPQKLKGETKKAVDSIMLPLYRTLYRAGSNKAGAPPRRAYPRGCARQRHPLQPW
jgi:hypothetical protein